eukprot:SM000136S00178  [mRNA]  locus=s136:249531:251441:+ [translate_table: standard]
MLPQVRRRLGELFTVHDYAAADDKDALLAEVAPCIRGVATTNFAGVSASLMDALPALEIISCFGVGVDSIDVGKARERGVIVTNTPDVLTDDVADLAVGLLLATVRKICAGDRYVSGKRVGIIGLGRIGLAIARRLEGFDCTIAYQSRRRRPDCTYEYHGEPAELAASVDFLVVACPLNPSTRHLVNRAVLDALGPDGVLVNIARGPVVDEKELVAALQEGRLGGAGLDVFEEEPQVPEALLAMDNVVLQPHVASATWETRGAMGDLTIANLQEHFAGKPVITPYHD